MNIEIKKSIKLIDFQSSLKFMQDRVKKIHSMDENELLWF